MHNIYMNQPGQTATPQYQAMPGAATGEEFTVHKCFASVHYYFDFILPSFSRSKYGQCVHVSDGRQQWTGSSSSSSCSGSSQY